MTKGEIEIRFSDEESENLDHADNHFSGLYNDASLQLHKQSNEKNEFIKEFSK